MTKPTKWLCAQRRLRKGIHLVWSVSSLSAWRKLGSLAAHWAHSEDSDQNGRMPKLIWVFAGRTCHFVGFLMRRLNSPGCDPENSYTASVSLRSSSDIHFPELHVSFISRHLSFTEEALRPRAWPIRAQSLPCFALSLGYNTNEQSYVSSFFKSACAAIQWG